MDKSWIKTKEAEYAIEARNRKSDIIAKINDFELLNEHDKQTLKHMLDKVRGDSYSDFELSAIFHIMKNYLKKNDKITISISEVNQFIASLNVTAYETSLHLAFGGLDRYLDSKPMEFDGDIIITDPCYIIRAIHHGTTPLTKDDWKACEYGEKMEALGIHHYMTRDTLYGDWSCTVYNTDTGEDLGEFCADAGLVSVFHLNEVLRYNPDFDYHEKWNWTTTLIPDFKGTVQFVVEQENNAGDIWEDYSVHVVGHGINKKTGKPVNFQSVQTGL